MNSNDRRIEAERIRREQDAAAAQRRRVEEEDRLRRQRDADERDRRTREEQDRQRRQRENQQALERQKRRQAGNDSCFVGSTPVLTPRGWKSISELGKGDQIVSYNSSTGKINVRSVRKQKKHHPAIIWEIYLIGVKDPISTTKAHSFLTKRGWQRTNKLRHGDEITTTGQHAAIVASVVKTERVEPVFNLLTDVDHTFVAGGCVVHNFTYFRRARVWWYKATMLSYKTLYSLAHVSSFRALRLDLRVPGSVR